MLPLYGGRRPTMRQLVTDALFASAVVGFAISRQPVFAWLVVVALIGRSERLVPTVPVGAPLVAAVTFVVAGTVAALTGEQYAIGAAVFAMLVYVLIGDPARAERVRGLWAAPTATTATATVALVLVGFVGTLALLGLSSLGDRPPGSAPPARDSGFAVVVLSPLAITFLLALGIGGPRRAALVALAGLHTIVAVVVVLLGAALLAMSGR
jgi:hypothetical protein